MVGLAIRNDRAEVQVSHECRLTIRMTAGDEFCGVYRPQEGYAVLEAWAPVRGLLYYNLPSSFESLFVRKEGVANRTVHRTLGQWPISLDEDELETYPYLHLLEERKTGSPWRLERWYTLAGPVLVYDSEYYFERSCPATRGRDWERLIVQLRQVIDLSALVSSPGDTAHLLTRGEPVSH